MTYRLRSRSELIGPQVAVLVGPRDGRLVELDALGGLGVAAPALRADVVERLVDRRIGVLLLGLVVRLLLALRGGAHASEDLVARDALLHARDVGCRQHARAHLGLGRDAPLDVLDRERGDDLHGILALALRGELHDVLEHGLALRLRGDDLGRIGFALVARHEREDRDDDVLHACTAFLSSSACALGRVAVLASMRRIAGATANSAAAITTDAMMSSQNRKPKPWASLSCAARP